MSGELLTNTDIQQRLEAAAQRTRKARAAEARLRRELIVTDRKLSAQRKICLGAALLLAVEHHPQHLPALRKLVLPHVTRPTDKAALADTPFAADDGAATGTVATTDDAEV